MKFVAPAKASSWIEVTPDSHFPIQNLPFGCIKAHDGPRVVSILGDSVIDLKVLGLKGLLPGPVDGRLALEGQREALYELFESSNPKLRDDDSLRREALLPADGVQLLRPIASIPQFVDFYSGIHHASNVGKMIRPDQPPLLPNYRHLPVGYNGRASSVVVSGTPIRRPSGQTKGPQDESPSFGPTRELDFELEFGFFLSRGTELGQTVSIEDAEDYVRGFVLVNDWSARDLQRWEYQPLGPFLAKSFATSISPWIVTPGALEPFRKHGPSQEPLPLDYLRGKAAAHYDVHLRVELKSPKMTAAQAISTSNAMNLYWSYAQQLAHQASNGTPLEAGDLYASGTISGETPDSYGSMLELTWRGERPIILNETGEQRKFLEDGDTLSMTGYCQGEGYRVGFGSVGGTVLPAIA